MSVDFNDCESCGTSMCECGDNHNYCYGCGNYLCNKCLVAPKETNEDGELLEECCPYCSGKEVHVNDLVRFLLKKLNLTWEEAVGLYKEAVL